MLLCMYVKVYETDTHHLRDNTEQRCPAARSMKLKGGCVYVDEANSVRSIGSSIKTPN